MKVYVLYNQQYEFSLIFETMKTDEFDAHVCSDIEMNSNSLKYFHLLSSLFHVCVYDFLKSFVFQFGDAASVTYETTYDFHLTSARNIMRRAISTRLSHQYKSCSLLVYHSILSFSLFSIFWHLVSLLWSTQT